MRTHLIASAYVALVVLAGYLSGSHLPSLGLGLVGVMLFGAALRTAPKAMGEEASRLNKGLFLGAFMALDGVLLWLCGAALAHDAVWLALVIAGFWGFFMCGGLLLALDRALDAFFPTPK